MNFNFLFILAKPTFVNDPELELKNLNATQGQKAQFFCVADSLTEPSPEIDFMINARKLDGKSKLMHNQNVMCGHLKLNVD